MDCRLIHKIYTDDYKYIRTTINLFSHPDYTVGTGIPSYQKVTGSAAVKQFADYTAGWDLHPTPKILFLLRVII